MADHMLRNSIMVDNGVNDEAKQKRRQSSVGRRRAGSHVILCFTASASVELLRNDS
jgi:hypothetical protein